MKKEIKHGNDLLYSLYEEFNSLMTDNDVDLEINPDSTIHVQSKDGTWRKLDKTADHDKIETLGFLLASIDETCLTEEKPILDTQMPYDGSRIHIKLPPTCENATLSWRKHSKWLGSLETLQKTGMFTIAQMEKMLEYVKDRRNIIISGETGSGKTTLLTSLINRIDPQERLLIVEDTPEIFTTHPNKAETRTSDFLSGDGAVKSTLRENPARIIYGEVRDDAALSLIESWNTAHEGGLGTIHANCCDAVKTRLLDLCSKRDGASNYVSAVNEALDVVIQISFKEGKRYISEIKEFKKHV